MIPGTILETVDAHKEQSFKHENLFLKTSFYDKKNNNTIIFNFNSFIIKYINLITRDYVEIAELTDVEYDLYRYNPKLFCKENYGTEELWSSLLLINNMISVTDFTLKKIKVFKTDIIDFIDEVFILEEREINENRENMHRIIKK